MSKKEFTIMTLVEVEEYIRENPEVVNIARAFKSSPLGKAIKRKAIEHDAITYLYGLCDNWYSREFIFDHAGLSYQEAAVCGLLEAVDQQLEWGEFYTGCKGFFTSVQDFLEFTKEQYSVDLTEPITELKFETDERRTNFKAFATGIVYQQGRNYFLNTERNENAEVYKKFYMDAFEYIVKLDLLFESVKKGELVAMDKILTNNHGKYWAVNYPVVKALVEEHYKTKEGKIRFFMRLSHLGFNPSYSRLYPFADMDEFICTVLTDIKELDPKMFPYTHDTGYNHREAGRQFCYDLFHFASESKDYVALTTEHKQFLFENILYPMLNNSVTRIISNNYQVEYFLRALFCCAPKDRIDEMFDETRQFFPSGDVLEAVRALGASNRSFYPTEKITNEMIRRGYNWNNIALPEDKMYDLDYIISICNRIGNTGVLFGRRYNANRFFLDKLDPAQLPKEFFIEFRNHIEWENVSYCRLTSLDFIKDNKETICFTNLPGKVAASIDEELAEWLLAQPEDEYYYERTVKCSKNLSADFIAQNLTRVWRFENGRRNVVAAATKVKLGELVSALG